MYFVALEMPSFFVIFATKHWYSLELPCFHPLRKKAYSNILKISPKKTENFEIKNSDIFKFLLKT